MSDLFFTSDLFRFGSTLLGIVISSWVIISGLKERTRGKIFEVITMVTFGIGGFASIASFITHFFFSDMVAISIGWPPGNPFQKEVAGANLAVGLLGFLGFWRRDFWLPYVIAKTAFLWIAGITHVVDLVQHQNLATGNAGLTLYMDFIWPLVYILLLWLTTRYGKPSPQGLEYRTPQL
ncbi:DUF6790 family protein [Candidatus Amarolinea dominans]|uniref:DUF6790 family protein n=1 Tax=Candidatus Amarolinea dominans TaxID=3140696 RepID=UPI003137651F|nr:hypothetical protein [Anaerolineae bacterium]MBK9095518.1 hypothetical protein [Anaerolineae bacterium]